MKQQTAAQVRSSVLAAIYRAGVMGLTNDQVSEQFGYDSSYFSPRLIELERDGSIIKLDNKRRTRKKRQANIYVHKDHYDPGVHKKSKEVKKAAPPIGIPMEVRQAMSILRRVHLRRKPAPMDFEILVGAHPGPDNLVSQKEWTEAWATIWKHTGGTIG